MDELEQEFEDSKTEPELMSRITIGNEESSIPSVSFNFDYCLNCYQQLNYDTINAHRNRNRNRKQESKPNKIFLSTIVDKYNGTTLLDILDLFFNIKHEAELQKLCLDTYEVNVSLCFPCSDLVEKMYTIFMEICKISKAPSFMSSFLQKYQLNKNNKLEKTDTEASDSDNEFILPHQPQQLLEKRRKSIGKNSDNRSSRQRQSRTRTCSKITNYKHLLDNSDAKVQKSSRVTSNNSGNQGKKKNEGNESTLTLPKKNIKDTSHLGGQKLDVGFKRKLGPSDDRKAALQRRIDRLKRMKVENKSKSQDNVLKSERPIPCEKCCAKFLKRSHYFDHAKCHETDEFASTLCNGTFNSEKNLKKHITLYHREHSKSKTILERQFVCSECDFPFTRKAHLKAHLAQLHQITYEVSSFPCPVCPKKFPTQKSLDVHLNKLHIPRVILRKNECDECGRRFVKKGDLTNHMTTHTNIRQFMCEVCGFKSKRPQDLSRHRKLVHLKEVNYTCDKCKKGFLSPWQLKAHQLTHDEKKSFLCLEPNCGKAFRCPNNLRQHMYVHKGIKHVCHFCGESYSRTAYLQRHIKMVHTNIEEPEKHNNESNKREPQIIYLTTTNDEDLMEGEDLHVYEDDPGHLNVESLDSDLLTSVATEVIVHEVQGEETIELNELDLSVEDDQDESQHVILDDDKYGEVIMEYIIS